MQQRRPEKRNKRASGNQYRTHNIERRNVVEVENKVIYNRPFDYATIILVIALLAYGLVMVYSASYYIAEIGGDSQYKYLIKQGISMALGLAIMIIVMNVDYHTFLAFDYDPKRMYEYRHRDMLKKPFVWALIAAVGTLLLVYSPLGINLNGSRRWINVGISIQPSEIVKIGLIIYISASVAENPGRLRRFSNGLLFPYLAILAVICAIIYFQPNFSAIACIVMLVFIMLFIGGADLKHLGVVAAIGIVGLIILLTFESYRMQRINDLVNPENSWQLKQSLYSFSAGGLFGRGLGNSMQKLLYLPYRESDFILAIIAEELGLFGVLILLLLFGLLIWRGVLIAIKAKDLMGVLMASGVTVCIAIQVVVNVGVCTGLLPPTGVVLPFISYGGSGVVVFLTMIGLLLSVSKQSNISVSERSGRIIPFYVEAPRQEINQRRMPSIESSRNNRRKKQYRNKNYVN